MRLKYIVACALSAIGVHTAIAQAVEDTLPLGARVQIHGVTATPSGDRSYYLKGVIAGGDAKRLIIARDSGAHRDTLPFFAMNHLQVSHGLVSRSDMVLNGTLVGLAVGAGAYGLIHLAVKADDAWSTYDRKARIGIPVLALIGLSIGSFADNEMWVSVQIPGGLALPRR